jgi:hypothetical protein
MNMSHIEKYTPESIMAAVSELNRRGKLSDDELYTIKKRIQERVDTEKHNEASNSAWKIILYQMKAHRHFIHHGQFGDSHWFLP